MRSVLALLFATAAAGSGAWVGTGAGALAEAMVRAESCSVFCVSFPPGASLSDADTLCRPPSWRAFDVSNSMLESRDGWPRVSAVG